MDEEKKLIVKKIENGTVIDHIKSGKGLLIMKILRVNSGTECYLAQNVESKKLGRKDIVKIVGNYPAKEQIDDIALIAPDATINYVRDRKIAQGDKYRVELPSLVEGFIRCPNHLCITNNERWVKTRFDVLQQYNLLQCLYCNTLVKMDEVEKYVI